MFPDVGNIVVHLWGIMWISFIFLQEIFKLIESLYFNQFFNLNSVIVNELKFDKKLMNIFDKGKIDFLYFFH